MAASAGAVTINVDTDLKDSTRRLVALEMAVRVASTQQVGSYNGDIIVNVAKGFETYLAGEGDS